MAQTRKSYLIKTQNKIQNNNSNNPLSKISDQLINPQKIENKNNDYYSQNKQKPNQSNNKYQIFNIPFSLKKVNKIQKLKKNLLRCIKTQHNPLQQFNYFRQQFLIKSEVSQYSNKNNKRYENCSNIKGQKVPYPINNRYVFDKYKQIIDFPNAKSYYRADKSKKQILQKIINNYQKSKNQIYTTNLLNLNSGIQIKRQQGTQRQWSLNFVSKPIHQSNQTFQITKIYQRPDQYTVLNKSQISEKKRIQTQNNRLKNERQRKEKMKTLTLQKQLIEKVKRKKAFKIPFQKYYYRDFLWKICYSHQIQIQFPAQYPKLFRFYVGPGNNKMLIKGLMRRRSWWICSQKMDDAHFIWTQIKIKQIFHNQKKNKKIIQKNTGEQQKAIQKNINKIQNNNNYKILPANKLKQWNKYFINHTQMEEKIKQNLQIRSKIIGMNKYLKVKSNEFRIHNHLQNNYVIGNKKALFHTMFTYYKNHNQNIFQSLPLTFHIKSGLEDPIYYQFLKVFYQKAKQIKKQQNSKNKNIWIVKPGEFTNRGNGITVCLSLQQIKNIVKSKQKHANGQSKTFIVQQYIDKPFLYCKRKFDIRHYMMITSINGIIRGYWYKQGYIRTTSFEYTLKTNLTGIHLTNDAVQKYLPQYGKYQKGNKLSYQDFQKYLDKQYSKKYNFFSQVYPKMKKIATDATRAAFLMIDPQKRQHNFQIFGMDFMIDQNFNPWLIQINTNPCLELSCPLLAQIIPNMVENALKVGLDPLFPPPINFPQKKKFFDDNILQNNRFQLIFDMISQGQQISQKYDLNMIYKQDNISEDDQVYQDDGKELDD